MLFYNYLYSNYRWVHVVPGPYASIYILLGQNIIWPRRQNILRPVYATADFGYSMDKNDMDAKKRVRLG